MKPRDDWLAIGEASELLGISPTTLRRYERDGLIKSQRTPTNQRRFRRRDVEQLLAPAPKAAS